LVVGNDYVTLPCITLIVHRLQQIIAIRGASHMNASKLLVDTIVGQKGKSFPHFSLS
jgi:hypothetical protein